MRGKSREGDSKGGGTSGILAREDEEQEDRERNRWTDVQRDRSLL